MPPEERSIKVPLCFAKGLKPLCPALLLAGCLALASAQAGDMGPRHHAEGQYDAATSTYRVVAGDDLAAITERFDVTMEKLTKQTS